MPLASAAHGLVIAADMGKEQQAERIARDLRCAWVAPPAELGPNADVNDLHARDGLDAVTALLSNPNVPAGRFRLLSAKELDDLPAVEWRIRGVLPTQGLAALYGPSGSGKGFLALDLLAAVAGGHKWFDGRTSPCPVTYCALEGEAGIAQRIEAYRQRYGAVPEAMRFILQSFDLTDDQDVVELAQNIRSAGAAGGIVVIDTLNRPAPGSDENSSKDMGLIIVGAKSAHRSRITRVAGEHLHRDRHALRRPAQMMILLGHLRFLFRAMIQDTRPAIATTSRISTHGPPKPPPPPYPPIQPPQLPPPIIPPPCARETPGASIGNVPTIVESEVFMSSPQQGG